jgi:hypothetical protein
LVAGGWRWWLAAVLCGGALWYLAPGAEANCKATGTQRDKTKMHLSGAKFNRVWHRKGAFWNRKGQKITQKKIDKHFPLFLGLKIKEFRPASSPKN